MSVLGLCWVLATLAGMRMLYRYQGRPGASAEPPANWPAASRVVPDRGRFTLVMAVHPGCACSLASLERLARILAACEGRLAARVTVLAGSAPGEPDWGTRARGKCAAIPGVEVIDDPGGEEAARFGALTSGHVVLYDPRGRRLFSGGVTAARGHAGDNAASDAIVALVFGRPATLGHSPVFGCRMTDPESTRKTRPP